MESRLETRDSKMLLLLLHYHQLLCYIFLLESFAERQFRALQFCMHGIVVSSFNCEMDALSMKHRFNAIRQFVLLIHVLLAQEMFMQIV